MKLIIVTYPSLSSTIMVYLK